MSVLIALLEMALHHFTLCAANESQSGLWSIGPSELTTYMARAARGGVRVPGSGFGVRRSLLDLVVRGRDSSDDLGHQDNCSALLHTQGKPGTRRLGRGARATGRPHNVSFGHDDSARGGGTAMSVSVTARKQRNGSFGAFVFFMIDRSSIYIYRVFDPWIGRLIDCF